MSSAQVAAYGSFESWDRGSAVSSVASHLQEMIASLFRSADDAQSLTGREAKFENELRAALDELVPGDDQCAVSAAAVQRALQLVRALPPDVPVPGVAIDPDGEVALDWMPSRTRGFSISVGDSDRLAYALMDGSSHAHGVVRFTGVVPALLLQQLVELTADQDAAIRVA